MREGNEKVTHIVEPINPIVLTVWRVLRIFNNVPQHINPSVFCKLLPFISYVDFLQKNMLNFNLIKWKLNKY